jgi:hypothetical protein
MKRKKTLFIGMVIKIDFFVLKYSEESINSLIRAFYRQIEVVDANESRYSALSATWFFNAVCQENSNQVTS